MRLFHKKQKSALAFFLILELFALTVLPASAAKKPSVSSIAAQLEARYHLNLGSIQNQGESFNVSDDKKLTPEVSLFFSPSDPKPGAKLSAKAFPIYFSNPEEALYYTWYLKRDDCDLTNSPSRAEIAACDRNNDANITVEDWKIEAMRILAQNGYEGPASDAPTDDDGYRARYGGDNKTNVPNHCYVHDNVSGKNYELGGSSVSSSSFGCPAGTTAVCMEEEEEITSGVNNTGTDFFTTSDSGTCYVSGIPACSAGAPLCGVGTARCVSDLTSTDCGSAFTSCSTQTSSTTNLTCTHLFPNATNGTSGDGAFGAAEETFWGTDPNDPDTADNGNKDEANVVGLGRSTFTWNYAPGDQVGVAVEGTSMIPTKYDDSSYMIMWAFPKNTCPISLAAHTGSYTKSIRGYLVSIPTAQMDLNRCIRENLVDPAQGGQSTNLDVSVTATPDSPINDETTDNGGDTVIAQASVSNAARGLTDTLFDWNVEISSSIQFDNATDITDELRSLGLLGNTKGNALDTVKVKLDMPRSLIARYLINGTAYLRFKVAASENFTSGITRKGRSDIIVKFTSTGKKISAYKARPMLAGGAMKATLSGAPLICNNDALDRAACRIIKNEIIGLKIDPAGLSSFHWTINGAPLTCSYAGVSTDCTDGEQNEVNFFPVTGNIGDTYTVAVTGNDVATGNIITLVRTFHIVQPEVSITSLDKNAAWPKFLGQYRDITGQATAACPGGLCNDYSTSIFQAYSGGLLGFRAAFIPSFLENVAVREWTVDGQTLQENAPGQIGFVAEKLAESIYNIGLSAQVAQSSETRRALLDIWGISPFDSPEINFSIASQVEVQEPGIVSGPLVGPRKYLAAIASYIPGSVLFTFRILLSAVLVLFTANFLYALLQERRVRAFVASLPGQRR